MNEKLPYFRLELKVPCRSRPTRVDIPTTKGGGFHLTISQRDKAGLVRSMEITGQASGRDIVLRSELTRQVDAAEISIARHTRR